MLDKQVSFVLSILKNCELSETGTSKYDTKLPCDSYLPAMILAILEDWLREDT